MATKYYRLRTDIAQQAVYALYAAQVQLDVPLSTRQEITDGSECSLCILDPEGEQILAGIVATLRKQGHKIEEGKQHFFKSWP